MSCNLSVVGRHFDVDTFLQLTQWRPDRTWRKGESGTQSPRVAAVSGFMNAIGRSDFGPLKTQVSAAIRFLEAPRNERMLTALAKTKGVDQASLDFGIPWEPVVAQFDWLPPRLVTLAGKYGLGLIVSHYPIRKARRA